MPASIPASMPICTYCMFSMRLATWRWETWASSWAMTPASSASCSSSVISPVKT